MTSRIYCPQPGSRKWRSKGKSRISPLVFGRRAKKYDRDGTFDFEKTKFDNIGRKTIMINVRIPDTKRNTQFSLVDEDGSRVGKLAVEKIRNNDGTYDIGFTIIHNRDDISRMPIFAPMIQDTVDLDESGVDLDRESNIDLDGESDIDVDGEKCFFNRCCECGVKMPVNRASQLCGRGECHGTGKSFRI